jgi:hypothetical protein
VGMEAINMKCPALVLGLLVCSATASAQQTAMVQMQCRDLASTGNSINPDEVLVNGMACRTVKQVSAANSAAVSPAPASQIPSNQFAPSDAPAVSAAPAAKGIAAREADQPVSDGQIAPGSRIVIAPMGGFETYFAAAMREKKVPVRLTLDKDSAQFFVVSTETEWHGFVYGSGGSASWSPTGGSAAHGAAASSTRGLEASIMLIDAKTKDVVWAYEVHKNSHGGLLLGTHAARGQQSLAEACAKHLKEFIEKGK